MNIHKLPEDCLTKILSLTTPIDVLRSSVVSRQFLSASKSDTVWDKFMPSGCNDIISRPSSSISIDQFISKKDLFVYLCRFPILIDNNTKSFALYKRSGRTWYMLGARALSITSGDNPASWSWESVPESRFPECAVLKGIHSLEIKGKIHTALLSPGSLYDVYFVFKVKANYSASTGFERVPMTVWVSEADEDGLSRDDHHIGIIYRPYLKAPGPEELGVRWRHRSAGRLPSVRRDGWMEIAMGRYKVCESQRLVLEMTLKEVLSVHWKNGLIVHGIDIRPLF